MQEGFGGSLVLSVILPLAPSSSPLHFVYVFCTDMGLGLLSSRLLAGSQELPCQPLPSLCGQEAHGHEGGADFYNPTVEDGWAGE